MRHKNEDCQENQIQTQTGNIIWCSKKLFGGAKCTKTFTFTDPSKEITRLTKLQPYYLFVVELIYAFGWNFIKLCLWNVNFPFNGKVFLLDFSTTPINPTHLRAPAYSLPLFYLYFFYEYLTLYLVHVFYTSNEFFVFFFSLRNQKRQTSTYHYYSSKQKSCEPFIIPAKIILKITGIQASKLLFTFFFETALSLF